MLRAIVEIPPFRLDPTRGALLHGEREIKLRPRTRRVLEFLVEHAGEVVSKEQLLRAVWSDVVVTEQTLSTSISELRRALVDDPRAPRFIETVHGRGFRFVALPLEPGDEGERGRGGAGGGPEIVGRESPLARLAAALERAARGERQVVFVSGESGIGKTALVEAFLAATAPDAAGPRVRVVRTIGQCVEFSGPGEPFMPIVGALRVLTRGPESRWVIPTVRRLVPPWMAELLGAADPGENGESATDEDNRVRALRLLAETLEEIGRDVALVLVLEDLHWCDASTLDLINLFARRSGSCRVLIVGTLRPEEGQRVAMLRELTRKGKAERLELEGLSRPDVELLVERRLGGDASGSADLAARLQSWTGGIPFLLVEILERLREAERVGGAHAWPGGPDDADEAPLAPAAVVDAIEARLAPLSGPERAALEIAAVAGGPFEPEAVAAVARDEQGGLGLEAIESLCRRLAGAGAVLVPAAPTEAARPTWSFRHALYRETLRAGVVPSRRRRIHLGLGEWHAKRKDAPATALAHHFEQAGELTRALPHYRAAAGAAKDRQAEPEAIGLLRSGLRCVEALPEGAERLAEELAVRIALAGSILSHAGYTHPEIVPLYSRAYELAEALEQPAMQAVATGGLFFAHLSAARVREGYEAALRLLEVTRGMPAFFVDAGRTAHGVALFARGDLAGARAELERPPDFVAAGAIHFEVNGSVMRLGALATVQAHQGDLSAAETSIGSMLAAGAETGRIYDVANAHRLAAEYWALVGDAARAREHGARTTALAEEHELGQLRAIGAVLLGWARAVEEGDASALQAIASALEDLDARGYRLMRSTFCARQAEAALAVGALDTALEAVECGLEHVRETGERRHESDLHRLRGSVLRARGASEEAVRASLEAALRVAREQGAQLLVLRARVEDARTPGAGAATARRALAELVAGAPRAMQGVDLAAARVLLDS